MDARIRRFALLGTATLLVMLCLYPFVLPSYRNLVVAASRLLLSQVSPPIGFSVQASGAWLVSVPASKNSTGLTFTMDYKELGTEVMFLGLAILPALVLATPGSVPTRLRLLMLSLIGLFAIHTLSVSGVILIMVEYCYGRESARATCRVIAESLTTCSLIAVFGLWAALTWRHWFGGAGRPVPHGSKRRR